MRGREGEERRGGGEGTWYAHTHPTNHLVTASSASEVEEEVKKKRGPKKGAKKAAAADKKTKKVKKEKKKKDPNAPKRPRSAFLYYSGKQRPNVKKENPSATFADVARILGEQWKALDANLKKVYSSPLSPLLSLFLGSSLSRTRSVEGPKNTNLKKVTSLYPILSLPPSPSLLPPSRVSSLPQGEPLVCLC